MKLMRFNERFGMEAILGVVSGVAVWMFYAVLWWRRMYAALVHDHIGEKGLGYIVAVAAYVCLTVIFITLIGTASGGLTGFLARVVAKRRNNLGAETYWGMICGMVIMLPTAVLWGYLLSIGMGQVGNAIYIGYYENRLLSIPFILILDAAFIALVVIGGGLAGGVAGLSLKGVLTAAKRVGR